MSASVNTLLQMLTYARPMGGRSEQNFRSRWILSLPGAWTDEYGNIHVPVGESRTLFSCHTDTVNRNDTRQTVTMTGGIVRLAKGSPSNCLGADDTAGIWIMREMILANVPGYYVFHYGEERGGIGSGDLARDCGQWLFGKFDRAIAFDRRGTGDVITHQGGRRCASHAFATALASALNGRDGFTYAPSAQGIYTDTAEYASHIPECTNLSVGYQREHTRMESLDTAHCAALLTQCLTVPWETLPTERDPKAPAPALTRAFPGHGTFLSAEFADTFDALLAESRDAADDDETLCATCCGTGEHAGDICDTCDGFGVVELGRPLNWDAYEWDTLESLSGDEPCRCFCPEVAIRGYCVCGGKLRAEVS